MAIFPTAAVCQNFYKELKDPRFPNRFASYLDHGPTSLRDLPARKALELPYILRHGRVPDEFLLNPDLPSAPLRAFSYTQAGGSASCGKVGCVNALFKFVPAGSSCRLPCSTPPPHLPARCFIGAQTTPTQPE